MQKAELASLYSKYLGRPMTDADVAALGGETGAWTKMTPQQFAQGTIFGSPEFQKAYPDVSTEMGFQTAKGVKEAKQAYAPLGEAQRKLTQQQFETLKSDISQQKEKAIRGVSETLASRGLGRSGELGAQVGEIEKTALQQLATADINQTIAQADNALAEWQAVTGSASQIQQTAFSQALQEREQSFSQYLQGQNFNLGLLKDYSSTYGAMLAAFSNQQEFPEELIQALYRMSQLGGGTGA